MRQTETRPVHEIPPVELDGYLGSFFAGVRQKDGAEYEPDTLTSYQRGIDRYLSENGYAYSICRDLQFRHSQETLKAKRSQLKSQGKGNKPNAAEELSEREEDTLYEKGVIGTHSPEALLFLVWLNNQKHFGFRGCQESRQMLWGDVALKKTVDNIEYLEFNERENKTRSSGKVNEQPRAYPPKAFAVPDDPTRCPVFAYKQYALHRPPSHLGSDADFYLAINYKPETNLWYKRQPMGANKLDTILSTMCNKAGIAGKKTNHSIRRSTIRRLHDSGIPPTKLMQLSGHRNVQSINHYAVNSMDDQHRMSEILSRSQGSRVMPSASAGAPPPPHHHHQAEYMHQSTGVLFSG
ncbi:uncharacterized protein KIAA1958-like [Ptychodera flava]|uniref:uncharacterized protein KIAA1958-like n=1 Tax=Ptychodera flava TaxID=63121 RepID=UPI00396A6271